MDGQISLFDFAEFLPEDVPFEECMNPPIEVNVCKFSNHTCNKEELWNVAQSFDDIQCQKKCCRQCSVRMCGARCNGSEEPNVLEVNIRGLLDDGYCPNCNLVLDDLVEECPECHARLDWTLWKRINERR